MKVCLTLKKQNGKLAFNYKNMANKNEPVINVVQE
jgi:hypothetical protein